MIILFREQSWYFFLGHPLLMGLAFPAILIEGITTMRNSSLLLRNAKESRNMHYWTSIIAYLCWLGGFWIIYENKEMNRKQHFKSYHSWMGVFVILLVPLQMIIGRKFWIARDWVTKFIPDSYVNDLRLAHKQFGKWIVALASIAVVLASYSNWVTKKTQIEQMSILVTSWIFFGMSFYHALFKK
jgi:cytochrome b561